MINVYWSSENCNQLLLDQPESVLQDLRKNKVFFGEETKKYLQCPGYTNFFKNVYVVKSDTNFELTYKTDNGEVIIEVNKPQKFFDENISIVEYSMKQQLIHLPWYRYFFTEKPLEVSVFPAFLHHNDLTNHYVASGKFDISQWFRPLYPSITLNSGKLKIKKGDALYYIQFHTDENIDFKHFNFSKELGDVTHSCLGVKDWTHHLGLNKLYNLFARKNYNKKVMEGIKKNLTGDFE